MDVLEFIEMRQDFEAQLEIDPEADPHDLIMAEAELLATAANDNDNFDQLIAEQERKDQERGHREVMVQVGDRFIPQRRRLEE